MPRLPSAGDVQTVPLRRDPGVSVPNISVPRTQVPNTRVPPPVQVPQGAFDSTLGTAAQELAPGLANLAEGFRLRAEKQQRREDVVEVADKEKKYRIAIANIFAETDTQSDFSDKKVLAGFGAAVSTVRQDILKESSSLSEDSRAMLEAQMIGIESDIIGKAAARSVAIGKDKVRSVHDDRNSPIFERVRNDPSVENIERAFLELDRNTELVSGAFEPEEESALRSAGREDVVLTALNQLHLSGNPEEAYLRYDKYFNELSRENQITQTTRIQKAINSRQEAEHKAEVAGAVARAKFAAKREYISGILSDAGAPPIDESGIPDNDATLTPFATAKGEGEEKAVVSEDAQDVARLFSASRRLLAKGEASLAGGLLAQARFIVENSSEMQLNKELDKPVSEALASELGVPIGTSLRTVMGVIPRSPEEIAESRSAASARGGKRIEGEEQIAFIDEATTMITDLLGDLQEDPKLVGATGSLRATGQSALGVLGDLGGTKLVEQARSLAFENTDLGLDDVNNLFDDPTLSVLSILENSIGLILARLRAPDGRIPVDVIKRSIDDVSLTGLKGSEQVINRLNFVLGQLNRRSGAIEQRFNLPTKGGKKSEIGTPYYRVIDGKLQLVDEK